MSLFAESLHHHKDTMSIWCYIFSFLFLVFFFFPLPLVLLSGSVFSAGLDLVRLAVGLSLLLDTLGLDLECIPWAEAGLLVDGLGMLAKRFGWEYERMPGELEGFPIMGRCTCSLLMLLTE